MITREDELNIDFGLNTIFDGGKYRLVMAQSDDEYPIGGLICEYIQEYVLEKYGFKVHTAYIA